MKFNIDRPPKHVRRRREKRAKRKALEQWHSKFAWLPTMVDEEDESYRKVWFEKYMRQQRTGPTNSTFDDGKYFVKYSTKEYFKKKLNGDFEKDKDPWTDVSHDGTNASFGVSAAVQRIESNTKYYVGGMDEDIRVYDENGNETEL